MEQISRSSFLKGAAGGLGAAALGLMAGCGQQAASSTTTVDTTPANAAEAIRWDAEYDVVVMGIGFSGCVAAKTAADNGANVVIVEKCSEGESGGNSKVCGQMFAYGHEDVATTKKYYRALAGGRELDEEVLDVMSEGVAHMAGTLESEFGLNRDEFWELNGIPMLGEMSPEYPEKEGSEVVSLVATHMGVSDGYFYNNIKQTVLDRADKIDVWYESPALDLIQDPETKTVLGVKVQRGGQQMNVRALNGVVICTGGFEADKEMCQNYLNLINYAPRGGLHNTGDGIKMAQRAGADLWHMSVYEGLFGLGGVSFDVGENAHAEMISVLVKSNINTGSCILVGTDGERFLNESEVVRHGHLYDNGIWENPHFPEKMWLIFDQTQKDLIDADGLIPEAYVKDLMAFDTIDEMAAATGCIPETLKETITNFNSFAKNGKDYTEGRSAEYMRAFDGKKYYAIKMIAGLLNTQGGPKRNAKAEILDTEGNPIPHLYSAGEMGGWTVCMYQGGTNVAECIIFGLIAGKNAAAKKDALPAYVPAEKVESTPALPGEIDDLSAAEEQFETGANQYIGKAVGMNGDVVVRVTMDGDAIAQVEVLKESETPDIGGPVIASMPEQFIGMTTEDAINGVDNVSGATITSNALKQAVVNALLLASAN